MQRQGTESEIEADQGDHEWDQSATLNHGRRQILQDRRRRRRHVWKDASEVDIICLIASPCVKPEFVTQQKTPQLQHLTQSNENMSIIPSTGITTYGSHQQFI